MNLILSRLGEGFVNLAILDGPPTPVMSTPYLAFSHDYQID